MHLASLKAARHLGWETASEVIRRSLRESKGSPASSVVRSSEAALCLAAKDHWSTRWHAQQIRKHPHGTIGFYYEALVHYLFGRYEKALELLEGADAQILAFPDAAYLKAATYVALGRSEASWVLLSQVAFRSHRIKTWSVLADLVHDTSDFDQFLSLVRESKTRGSYPRSETAMADHISRAALRAREYDTAKDVWRGLLSATVCRHRRTSPDGAKKVFNTRLALEALCDIEQVLQKALISPFLVSGTLLGGIRDDGLLAHDKDVDIGIWNDVPRETLVHALTCCGLFMLLPIRSPDTYRVNHVNGTAIDVFYHHRERETFWHGGVKVRWHNTPFELVERAILGKTFLVPADIERYLTENYGEWRRPTATFDSAFDTPNAEIINIDEMIVHCLKTMVACRLKGDAAAFDCYADRLKNLERHQL